MTEPTLQDVLYTEIPLTRAIGIQVIDSTNDSLTLKAPLTNNINHKCTAFGGSLYSVSVLTGWGLLYTILKQHNLSGHIVIQESNTRFLKPVVEDIYSHCSIDNRQDIDKFIWMYKRKGIARIQLTTHIISEHENCVEFSGRYVVHHNNTPSS